MFIDNGDGTYTVRFYDPDGQPDYVTVDTMLPVYDGSPIYTNLGPTNNSLWLPLAEKAYAEWNETGNNPNASPPSVNDYASIEGGFMDYVDLQVLNVTATDDDWLTDESADVAALANPNMAVTIATDATFTSGADPDPATGLYNGHAYGIIGYNSANQTFQLYNPWGVDQPNQSLTWTQLQATCQLVTYVDTSQAVIPPLAGVTPPGTGVKATDPVLPTSITSRRSRRWAAPPRRVTPAARTMLGRAVLPSRSQSTPSRRTSRSPPPPSAPPWKQT